MDWIRIFLTRCLGLFNRKKLDDDLDDELCSHIDLAVEENLGRGMSEQDAIRKALRDFGGMTQTRERYRIQRGLPWVETVWQDIRFAFRQLLKSRGFTLTSILTLALGIGATTAIFSVVKAVLLSPLPYRDPGSIVTVWTANPDQGDEPLPSTPGDFATWKQRSGVFQDLAPSYDSQLTLTGQGSPQFLIGYAVSAEYLRILGVQPQLGRLYTDQEDKPGNAKVALLSNHLWRTTFHAEPDIVGRAVELNGSAYTVLGVMPRGFDYPQSVEIWIPAAMPPSSFDDFNHTYVRTLGRLRPGISAAQAQKTLNALEAQIANAHPETDHGNRVVLVPLRDQLDGDIREPLLILMGAVGLVLLIACANTAGLALARDAERQKEVAVRLALGATRFRLLRQFLTESLALALIGGTAGLLVAFEGSRLLLRIFPNDVANLNIPKLTHIPMNAGVFLFALAATMLTAILCGTAPVFKAMHVDAGIKESGRGATANRRSGRSRSVMVVFEVALALMLLSGAGLVVASFRKVVNVNLGFQPDHVLSLQLFLPPNRYPRSDDSKRARFVEEVVTRLRALPGVRSAGATNFLPLSGFWGTTNFLLPGQTPSGEDQEPQADNRAITPDYLQTMGIPLLRGRNLNADDQAGGLHVALINQAFARKYFADRDPLGESLNLGSVAAPDRWKIVGIVGDVLAFGQDQPIHADIYRPFAQHPFSVVSFVIRSGTDPASMVPAAEKALWSVDPELPVFRAVPLNVLARQTLAIRRASSALFSAFAALALLLACIGIYGLAAYAVVQRTKEIGVRMALGAQRSDVVRMIMGMGARLTLIGVAIGLSGALAAAQFLRSLLFGIGPMNVWIFALSIVLLVAVSLAASWLPAKRASSFDPMQALRTE